MKTMCALLGEMLQSLTVAVPISPETFTGIPLARDALYKTSRAVEVDRVVYTTYLLFELIL
jgi:hypothetical protein